MQRVAAVGDVLARQGEIGSGLGLGKGERFHTRGCIGDRRIRDARGITAEVGDHLLPVGIFAQSFVPRFGPAENPGLEIGDRTRAETGLPVGVDELVGPFARQAELAPGADVVLGRAGHARVPGEGVPAAAALGAENAVELLTLSLASGLSLLTTIAYAGDLCSASALPVATSMAAG